MAASKPILVYLIRRVVLVLASGRTRLDVRTIRAVRDLVVLPSGGRSKLGPRSATFFLYHLCGFRGQLNHLLGNVLRHLCDGRMVLCTPGRVVQGCDSTCIPQLCRTTVCREPVPIVLRGCDLIDVSTLFRFGIVLRRIRRPVVREGTSWLLGRSGGREILSVSVPVAVRAVSPPS